MSRKPSLAKMRHSFLRSEYYAGRYYPEVQELPFALTPAGIEYEKRTRNRITNLCRDGRRDPKKAGYVRVRVPFINQEREAKGFSRVECQPPLPPA